MREDLAMNLLGLENVLALMEFLSKSRTVHGAECEGKVWIHPDGVYLYFKKKFKRKIIEVTGKPLTEPSLNLGERSQVRRKVRL